MKMPFKDRIAPKQKKSDFLFAAPDKNQSSLDAYMPAGDDYGVGFAQPNGTKEVSNKSVVPKGAQCDLMIK